MIVCTVLKKRKRSEKCLFNEPQKPTQYMPNFAQDGKPNFWTDLLPYCTTLYHHNYSA